MTNVGGALVEAGLLDATVGALAEMATLGPTDAEGISAELRRRYPARPIDLLWHVEPFLQRHEYALLVRGRDDVIIAVSRAAGGLPWPMRGVQRWNDADVVRVNGRIVQVEEAVAFLDIDDRRSDTASRIIDACLVRDELDRKPIDISPLELQAEMDRFRRSRGLLPRADMQGWLVANGQTHVRLERRLKDQLAQRALRKRFATRHGIEERFAASSEEYDLVRFEWIASVRGLSSEKAILGARASLIEIAETRSESGRRSGDIGGLSVRRRIDFERTFPKDVDIGSGDPQGPVAWGDGMALIRILDVVQASFDEETSDYIEGALFSEWLAERRSEATIEWAWGLND